MFSPAWLNSHTGGSHAGGSTTPRTHRLHHHRNFETLAHLGGQAAGWLAGWLAGRAHGGSPKLRLLRREEVTRGDLEEAASLFHDAKYSARLLSEQAEHYMM